MNHTAVSQPQSHIIWDSDGSLDSVIGLPFFLQHPNVSSDALTIPCGEARPEMYTVHLPRVLARLGRGLLPIAAGRPTPLPGNNAFPPPWRDAVNEFLGIELPRDLWFRASTSGR